MLLGAQDKFYVAHSYFSTAATPHEPTGLAANSSGCVEPLTTILPEVGPRARQVGDLPLRQFVNALPEDREPEVHLDNAPAVPVPGIIAHQSAWKDGQPWDVSRFDWPA